MAEFSYHLDDIYRWQWKEFHFADGTIKDSRQVHWRQLPWERVVKVVLCIKGRRYEINPGKRIHNGFICYTNKYFLTRLDIRGNPFRATKRAWVAGYLTETHANMIEVAFKSGLFMRRIRVPISEVESHVHPRLKHYFRYDWNKALMERESEFFREQNEMINLALKRNQYGD